MLSGGIKCSTEPRRPLFLPGSGHRVLVTGSTRVAKRCPGQESHPGRPRPLGWASRQVRVTEQAPNGPIQGVGAGDDGPLRGTRGTSVQETPRHPVRPHPHLPYSSPGALASPQSHEVVPRAFRLTWTEGVESPTMIITAMGISNIRPLLSKSPRFPSFSDPSQFQGTLRRKQCGAEVLIPKFISHGVPKRDLGQTPSYS